jgi:hypothetical protein
MFPSDLTEEQRLKKSLVFEALTGNALMVIRKVREQQDMGFGEAIDYLYDRIEKNFEPMTCDRCRWFDLNYGECTNSNWSPSRDRNNAACEGISWELPKI